MSSLVFVRDAAGIPLMPTSAAHARILLQRGKAQRIPHQSFTLLQLTYAIPTPIVRPIIFDISFVLPIVMVTIIVSDAVRFFPLFRLWGFLLKPSNR